MHQISNERPAPPGAAAVRAIVCRARAVSTIDEISKKIDATRETREASIWQGADIRAQQKMLEDHEMRVRLLEAATRANPPITRP